MRFNRKGEIRRLKIIDRGQPPDFGRHHLHLFPAADMLYHAVGMDDVEAVVGIFGKVAGITKPQAERPVISRLALHVHDGEGDRLGRSEENTYELQSRIRISYAEF